MSDVRIEPLTSNATHDLRRRVLRGGALDADVEWDGDDRPDTIHVGAVVGGEVVATSTWVVSADPLAPDRRSVQLRGMATDPGATGRGLGRALLDDGLHRCRSAGVERVWANARMSAVGFYEAAGWTVSGPVFVTAATGLPHRHAHIDLG